MLREEALQLAQLLELAAQEGSIPSRETLLKAAETIRDLDFLCEDLEDEVWALSDELGDEGDDYLD